MEAKDQKVGSVVVLGGGVGGMQSALDLAESGLKVYLVDNKPAIGGVMSQLDKTFPTNDCSMCIVSPRLVDVGRHLNIETICNADLESLEGEAGNFKVTLKQRTRYIDLDKCTGCGACVAHCPVQFRTLPIETPTEIGLPQDLKAKLDLFLERYGCQKHALISILQDISTEYRYVPPESLRYISRKLDIPLPQVYHVTTFYTAFSLTPRGEFVIKVCMGTACMVRGGQRVVDLLEEKLGIEAGGTTSDMKFTLETVNCLGACAMGPVVTVNGAYHSIAPTKVSGLIESCRSAGN